MSALDDTDKKVLTFYRERIPRLEAENAQLRKEVAALKNLVADLQAQVQWDGRERRGTSVPPRTKGKEEA
jgi:cell division protein FtsB